MKYLQIPGDQNAVIWQDEDGSSGVIRASDADNSISLPEGSGGPKPGWQWDIYLQWLAAGNKPESMTPADTRSIDELRASTLQAINAVADSTLAPITSQYPRAEIDSWPAQCTEASAYLADPSAPTLLITTISGDLDEGGKRAFCESILVKAEGYKLAVGAVINWRRSAAAWADAQGRESLLTYIPQFPEVPNAP